MQKFCTVSKFEDSGNYTEMVPTIENVVEQVQIHFVVINFSTNLIIINKKSHTNP